MAYLALVVVLVFGVSAVCGAEYASVVKEPVAVSLSANQEGERWSRDADCPASVRVNIQHGKRDVILDLTLNDAHGFDAPLIVNDGKRAAAVHVPASGCFYRDEQSDIVVRRHSGGDHVTGRYVTSEGVFGLEADQSLNHVVYKYGTAKAAEGLMKPRVEKRDAVKYYIEVLPVFGYSFYKLHLELSGNNERKAMENIKFYCTQMMNEMAYIYERSDTGIVVVNVGCYVRKTAKQNQCLNHSDDKPSKKSGRKTLDGGKALEECTNYVMKGYNGLPKADHYMFLSSYDLYGMTGLGLKGMSWIAKVCTNHSISVVEDEGVHSTGTVGAHELAHNLGAWHDGEKNTCDPDAQNNMCPWSSPNGDNFARNSMLFSSCSIKYFNDYLSTVDCVENKPKMKKHSKWDKPLLSTTIDLDEQCAESTGLPHSVYCGGTVADHTCYDLACTNRSNICSLHVTAYQKTPCGSRKSCKDNVCVDDRTAPAMKPCQAGQSKELFRRRIVNDYVMYTCEELIKNEVSACYNEEVRVKCCETCAKKAKGQDASCPYGDKENWCKEKEFKDCGQFGEECCALCKDAKTGDPNCPYGDTSSNCESDSNSAWRCYHDSYRKVCCKSCGSFKTPDPACLYGNRMRCAGYESLCGRADVAKECCALCGPVITPGGPS